MIKNYLHYAVATAFFLASGSGNFAIAEVEVQPIDELERVDPKVRNDPIGSAQRLIIGKEGKVVIKGAIGLEASGGTPVADVDFYSFFGRAGDVLHIDIDEASKPLGSLRSLNALIGIFKPDGTVLRQRNDVLQSEVDEGSISRFDPHMPDVLLPQSGLYTVGVTSDGRYPDGNMRVFLTGGATTPFIASGVSNGTYKLIIQGVSPSALQISIDIKPGATSIAPFNPKSKGKIPVALISRKDLNDPSKDFDAVKVDRDSIRFGQTGTEAAGRCGKNGEDVDGDGLLDLVCHFETQDAHFEEGEAEATVTGTVGGMPFVGRGWLKIVPMKTKDD